MAWKTIGGRRYYYRNRREGDRVVSEYVAPEHSAELFVLLDQEDREERQAHREAFRAVVEADREVDDLLDDLIRRTRLAADDHLIRRGFHKRKGEWRRRARHGDRS